MAAADVDFGLWHANARSLTRIPSINSYVYYFPLGHIENSSQNNEIIRTCPPILCKVLYVRYICTNSDDQAFVKYLLVPIHKAKGNNNNNGNNVKTDQNDVVYFAKTITASDAITGGSLSVPRPCADSIFPRLNFSDDPPTQTLKMFDAHHNAYEFTHIYRGTPRRHLLTTGWSQFVKGKKLGEGDSVIFMQEKSTSRLCIGTKRWQFTGGVGFSADRVRHMIEKAGKGEPFEVEYYPMMGTPDFVVRKEIVDASMTREWRVGMRVKMVAKTKDSSRMTHFKGTIESVTGVNDNGYPWGMIQVTRDEPGILRIAIRVSPWQVECVEPSEEAHHLTISPPSKKHKAPITLPNKEDEFSFPDLTHLATIHNSATLHYSPFSSLNNTQAVSDYHNESSFGVFPQLVESGLGTGSMSVSAVLNLGSTSCFENASPAFSIKLFGQTIHVQGETVSNNVLSYGNG